MSGNNPHDNSYNDRTFRAVGIPMPEDGTEPEHLQIDWLAIDRFSESDKVFLRPPADRAPPRWLSTAARGKDFYGRRNLGHRNALVLAYQPAPSIAMLSRW